MAEVSDFSPPIDPAIGAGQDKRKAGWLLHPSARAVQRWCRGCMDGQLDGFISLSADFYRHHRAVSWLRILVGVFQTQDLCSGRRLRATFAQPRC